LTETDFPHVADRIPGWLTPGAAEALAVKLYRTIQTAPGGSALSPLDALKRCLDGYRNPIPHETMQFQIQLAVAEASDVEFVPEVFRNQPK
jgi:hypothetical protein